jgi:hypothetical protein
VAALTTWRTSPGRVTYTFVHENKVLHRAVGGSAASTIHPMFAQTRVMLTDRSSLCAAAEDLQRSQPLTKAAVDAVGSDASVRPLGLTGRWRGRCRRYD